MRGSCSAQGFVTRNVRGIMNLCAGCGHVNAGRDRLCDRCWGWATRFFGPPWVPMEEEFIGDDFVPDAPFLGLLPERVRNTDGSLWSMHPVAVDEWLATR